MQVKSASVLAQLTNANLWRTLWKAVLENGELMIKQI